MLSGWSFTGSKRGFWYLSIKSTPWDRLFQTLTLGYNQELWLNTQLQSYQCYTQLPMLGSRLSVYFEKSHHTCSKCPSFQMLSLSQLYRPRCSPHWLFPTPKAKTLARCYLIYTWYKTWDNFFSCWRLTWF